MHNAEEACAICGRWAPDVKTGSDVPIAVLTDGMGGRYHVGCLEDKVLPALHDRSFAWVVQLVADRIKIGAR